MPAYKTERLLLRPFTEADVEPFHRMTSEPAIVETTGGGISPDLSPGEVVELMHIAPLGDYKRFGYGRHAMVLKETGQVIGFTGLKYLPELNTTDIGYRLFPEYWGLGLATESCWPMLSFAFEELKLTGVIGIAYPHNKASCRILSKIGLDYIDDRDFDGEWVSYFSLARQAYLNRQGNQGAS
jgi:RimJ/RimL family protein N-acetyltransferase